MCFLSRVNESPGSMNSQQPPCKGKVLLPAKQFSVLIDKNEKTLSCFVDKQGFFS
jgi:hypothetical protein